MFLTQYKKFLPLFVRNFLRTYINQLKFIIFRVKKFGFLKTTRELLPIYINNICSIFISIPIAIFVFLLIPVVKIRLIRLLSERLGHFALNTEIMLCAFDVGVLNKQGENGKTKYFFYTDRVISNQQLYKMWKRVLPILPFPTIFKQVDKTLSILSRQYKTDRLKKTVEQGIWADDKLRLMERVPHQHVFFTKNEEKKGKDLMNMLGLPSGARYVCLAVRDSLYLNKLFPVYDWTYHDHRNADIMTYRKAALFLAEQGYYVIRMGKWVGDRFDVVHPHIIDYANSPFQSDFLDIYLSSQCEFFISTSTGIDAIPQLFRRPILFSNISVSRELQAYSSRSIFIPKKIKNTKLGRFLTFKEVSEFMILHDKLGGYSNLLQLLSDNHLELINNTEDEILDIVQEMEQRLNGTFKDDDDDLERQQNFWAEYAFYPPRKIDDIRVKLGRNFLRSML